MKIININENEGGQRLDRFLKKYMRSAPLSLIYRMIRKDVKVNGKRASQDTIIDEGDELTLYIPEDKLEGFIKQGIKKKAKKEFEVIYEDDDILVVNKPYGLLTHGDNKEKKNTLTNQVLGYLARNGNINVEGRTFSPAPANRLDRNTSGLVLFGKSFAGLKELNRLMRTKNAIQKYYLTIVCGNLQKKLVLKDKMVKDEERNKIQVLPKESREGRVMETIAIPLAASGEYTLTEILLITGRTHQIRAHLAKVGYPIIGDKKYGNPQKNVIMLNKYGLKSQFLHAYKLFFNEAEGKLAYLKGQYFQCPLPKRLQEIGEDLNVIK